MITRVSVGHKFISVNVVITDRRGKPQDPTLAEIEICRVSQIDGSLTIATEIGVNGMLTMTKQNNKTGFYGAAIDTEILGEGEYVIEYRIEVGPLKSAAIDYFSVGQIEKPGIILYK